METNTFVIYDNKLFRTNAPVLSIANRAFRFGDALFESIRVIAGWPLFVDLHIERISNAMLVLGMEPIPDLTVANLVAQIKLLLKRNNCENNARVRFTIFRKEGGFYTPITNRVSYTLEVYPIQNSGFEWKQTGLCLGFYTQNYKPSNSLSKVKSANALLYVMAAQFAKQNKFDDVLIFNTNRAIIETSTANLFYFLNNQWYTPPLEDGCLSGIMRFVLLALSIEQGIEIEERSLYTEDIPFVKEVFLTSAIHGVTWVASINDTGYANYNAYPFYELLIKKLAELTNPSVFLT